MNAQYRIPAQDICASNSYLCCQVANALERHLRTNGWDVLRPDRDAPNLQWEHYINWVAQQTLRGIPVIEIHGQVLKFSKTLLSKDLSMDTSWPTCSKHALQQESDVFQGYSDSRTIPNP